jgi:hypothetical protein
MKKDESTHQLETRIQRGLSVVNVDEGGQMDALPSDKETKGAVSRANTDEGGLK